MNSIKYIICLFFSISIYAKKNDENITSINKNKYIVNQISKIMKKEFNKFFKIYKNGHDLTQLYKININDQRSKVHALLGYPLQLNKNPNVEYYLEQTSFKFIFAMFFKSGRIVRITYKNNKISKISKINLKQNSPSIPIQKITNKFNQRIKEIQINI